jgi:hypothetical protein
MFIRFSKILLLDPIRSHINPCYIHLSIYFTNILVLFYTYIYAYFLQVVYPPDLITSKLRMNLQKTAP